MNPYTDILFNAVLLSDGGGSNASGNSMIGGIAHTSGGASTAKRGTCILYTSLCAVENWVILYMYRYEEKAESGRHIH